MISKYEKVEIRVTSDGKVDLLMFHDAGTKCLAAFELTHDQFRSFAMVVMEGLEDVKALKRTRDMKGK